MNRPIYTSKHPLATASSDKHHPFGVRANGHKPYAILAAGATDYGTKKEKFAHGAAQAESQDLSRGSNW